MRTLFPIAFAAFSFSASAALAQQGDAAYGEYLAQECAACHQVNDESYDIPPIFGLEEDLFVEILMDYRDGFRENDVMMSVAGSLDEEMMWSLAAYYGAITPSDD